MPRGHQEHPSHRRTLFLRPDQGPGLQVPRLPGPRGRHSPEPPGRPVPSGRRAPLRRLKSEGRRPVARGAPADRETQPGGVLPDLLRDHPDGPADHDRDGLERRRDTPRRTSAGEGARLVGVHAGGLPDRSVPHRPLEVQPVPGPVPVRRPGLGPRHRPGLSPQHPGGTHRESPS